MGLSSNGIPSKERVKGRRIVDVPFRTFKEKGIAVVDLFSVEYVSLSNNVDKNKNKNKETHPDEQKRFLNAVRTVSSPFAITFIVGDGVAPVGKRRKGEDGKISELQSFISRLNSTPSERGKMYSSMDSFKQNFGSGELNDMLGEGLIVFCQGTGEADYGVLLVVEMLEALHIEPLPVVGIPSVELKSMTAGERAIHPCLKSPYSDIDYKTISPENPYEESFVEEAAKRMTDWDNSDEVTSKIVPKDKWFYVIYTRDGDIGRSLTKGTVFERITKTAFGYNIHMYDLKQLNESIGIEADRLQVETLTQLSKTNSPSAEDAKERLRERADRIENDPVGGQKKEEETAATYFWSAEIVPGDTASFCRPSQFSGNKKRQAEELVKKEKKIILTRSKAAAAPPQANSADMDVDEVAQVEGEENRVEESPEDKLKAERVEEEEGEEEEEREISVEEIVEDFVDAKKPPPATVLNIFIKMCLTNFDIDAVGKLILDAGVARNYVYATPGSVQLGVYRSLISATIISGFPRSSRGLPLEVLKKLYPDPNFEPEKMKENFGNFGILIAFQRGWELFGKQLLDLDFLQYGFDYTKHFTKQEVDRDIPYEQNIENYNNADRVLPVTPPSPADKLPSDNDATPLEKVCFNLEVRSGLMHEDGVKDRVLPPDHWPGIKSVNNVNYGTTRPGDNVKLDFFTLAPVKRSISSPIKASVGGMKASPSKRKSWFERGTPGSALDFDPQTMCRTNPEYMKGYNSNLAEFKQKLKVLVERLEEECKIPIPLNDLQQEEVIVSLLNSLASNIRKAFETLNTILLPELIDNGLWSAEVIREWYHSRNFENENHYDMTMLVSFVRKIFRYLGVLELEPDDDDTPTDRLETIKKLKGDNIPLLLRSSPYFLSMYLTARSTRRASDPDAYKLKSVIENKKWKVGNLKHEFVTYKARNEGPGDNSFLKYVFELNLMENDPKATTIDLKLNHIITIVTTRGQLLSEPSFVKHHKQSKKPDIFSEWHYLKLLEQYSNLQIPNFGKTDSFVKTFYSAVWVLVNQGRMTFELANTIDWNEMVEKGGDALRKYLTKEGMAELEKNPQVTRAKGVPGGKVLRVMAGNMAGNRREVTFKSKVGLDKVHKIIYCPVTSIPSDPNSFSGSPTFFDPPSSLNKSSSVSNTGPSSSSAEFVLQIVGDDDLPPTLQTLEQVLHSRVIKTQGPGPNFIEQNIEVSTHIKGDGDCLFVCLEHYLSLDRSRIRRELVAHIKEDKDKFYSWRFKNDNDETEFSRYLESMAMNGTWGDSTILDAAKKLYGLNYVVLSVNPDKITAILIGDGDKGLYLKDSHYELMGLA